VIVVSDSSPLVTLSKLSHFDLLRSLFSRICISREVYHEVVVFGAGLPGSTEVAGSNWIEVRELANRAVLLAMQKQHSLGIGELSCIALAKELPADVVLLDDFAARTLAKREGFQVRRTVGLLETSFLKGHISDLRAAFAQLLKYSYVDKNLLDTRLRSLGLSPL
jgi:uncharacterized protein